MILPALTLALVAACPVPMPAIETASLRVLVMPFENSQRVARLYWLSEASSILVAGEMGRLGAAVIARHERRRAYERLQLPSTAALTEATTIKVGQLVGATDLVVGSYDLDGENLVARARRIRLDIGRISAEQVERGPLADLMAIFGRLGRRVLEADARPGAAPPIGRSSAEQAWPPPATTPPLAAFENFVKGLLAETPEGQARYLEAAIGLHADYPAARLALWHARTALGEPARALDAAEGVAMVSPLGAEARFLAALSEVALQRFDAAIARLTELGGTAPTGTVLNNLGVAHLRKGDSSAVGRAAYYFSKAIEADPVDADYCFNLGYTYALARDHQAALYWLREGVRRTPADAGAHELLGAVLAADGANVEAERERELARQLGRQDEGASRPGRGAIPRGLERLKQALSGPASSLIDIALTATGDRDQRELASFHLERGRRLFDEKKDREAASEIGRAVFLLPYDAEAHLLLGRIHLRGGRTREGIDALKVAVWCQDTAAGRVALAEAYLQAHDQAAARVEVTRALAIDPRSPEALAIAARIGQRPPGLTHPV